MWFCKKKKKLRWIPIRPFFGAFFGDLKSASIKEAETKGEKKFFIFGTREKEKREKNSRCCQPNKSQTEFHKEKKKHEAVKKFT